MVIEREDIIKGDLSVVTALETYPQWLKDRLDWFTDLKFGILITWGPYSQFGCIEGWPLCADVPWARPDDLPAWNECGRDLEKFRAAYINLNTTFNPVRFDPVAWADEACRAGMRYVCFTTSHLDGFCMWDTRTTDYRITHPSCRFHADPRSDVTREVFDAFRAQGFAISCYFSKCNWHSPDYWIPGKPALGTGPNYDPQADPERWERYVRLIHEEARELLSAYGMIDVLWLDDGWVRAPWQDIRIDELVKMARSLQPGLIVADRSVGGPHENIITPEQEVPVKPLGRPWETCMTLGHSWSYAPNDNYKSARTVIHMLLDIVSKGGNYLLGVGPDASGDLPGGVVKRLREIGRWLDINGEAIYASRPLAPYAEPGIRYTCKGTTAFAAILAEEGQELPRLKVKLGSVRPATGAAVCLLGYENPLPWRMVDGQAEVVFPSDGLPCEHAWVLRFPLAGGR